MKKHLLILLLALTSFSLQAQNEMRVVGKGESLSGEQLIDRSIRDANGETCAGLMISTDLVGLTYTSYNNIVKVNKNPGKDLIFLSPEERVVEVYCSGFFSLKIILNDYGINLKSGEVWQLKVTGDKISDLIPISIITEPEGSDITIDGVYKGTGTVHQLSLGKHNITVSKSGRQTVSKEIEVTSTQVLFNFTLPLLQLKTITISSIPTGAKLYVEGIEEGVTNNQIFRVPGKYKIKLSLSGYFDAEEEITVTETGANTFEYRMNKNSVTLSINIDPADAGVLINKKNYTNKRSIELAPGSYQIEITKNGYKSKSDYIELKLGSPITKTYNLEQLTGSLQFRIKPIEARVTLKQNGVTKENWTGAKIIQNISVGSYTIECTMNGYSNETKPIDITEGVTTELNVNMQRTAQTISNKKEPIGNMVYVEGGTYMMGSDEGESDEKPVHRVTLNSFYIGKYEVTQKEWQEIMGGNPSYFKGDDLPVEKVSWNDVQEYLRKLNAKTGGKYRLPTEAEWEYAARGGASTGSATALKYSGSNNVGDVAWYNGNSGSKTHTVGTKPPNELGIYDMSGNVWEWCADWYDKNYYASSPSNNPQGPSSGTSRVLRGGCWVNNVYGCRSAYRSWYNPDVRYNSVGFRVVQDL